MTTPNQSPSFKIEFFPGHDQRKAELIRMVSINTAIRNLTALVKELNTAAPIESLNVNAVYLLNDVFDCLGFTDEEKIAVLGFLPQAINLPQQ